MTTITNICIIFNKLYKNDFDILQKDIYSLKEARIRYLCYEVEYNSQLLFDLAIFSLEDIGDQLKIDLSYYYDIINLLFQQNSISKKINELTDYNGNNFLHIMINNKNFFTMKFFLRSLSCTPKIVNNKNLLDLSPFELALNIKDLDIIKLLATHEYFNIDKSLTNYDHYNNLDVNTKEFVDNIIQIENKLTAVQAIAEILKPIQILKLCKNNNFNKLLDDKDNIKKIIIDKYPFISKYKIHNKN